MAEVHDNAITVVGGHHAGQLPLYLERGLGDWPFLASLLFALAFGTVFVGRPASVTRTAVKTAAVALLLIACFLTSAPWPLMVGLAFSALGDAFLAVDSERRLRLGIASFFVAQLSYVLLFCLFATVSKDLGPIEIASVEPTRWIAIGLLLAVAAAMLAWLWGSLGPMRLPVTLYVAAISAMASSALAMPAYRGPATIGALLFFVSDAILATQLFRGRLKGRVGALAVWWFYYLGQASIFLGFAGTVTG